jgi:Na+:H+ antiporter, NhaA family
MSVPHAAHPTLWPLRFISVEAMSGIVLLAAAALALAWANSRWAGAYRALWHFPLGLGIARFLPASDLHFWVNDALMTIFFLVVGLEIRREMHDGALSNLKIAALPMIAALGGVVLPALLYLVLNGGSVTRRGWAIPTATDIAFAVGVLSLIARVPPALRLLLLTLAIVDDIAAILVIALFYSNGITLGGLLIVAAGVLLVLLMQYVGVQAAPAYVLPGAVVWFGMLHAGVHPTLTGVLLGLLTPASVAFGRARAAPPRKASTAREAPVVRVQATLHPYVAFGIMPLFALANAGVSLTGLTLSAGAPFAVVSGVVAGLVLGKPGGIVLASLAAVRLGWCALPEQVHWRHMVLLGLLGGIGFTMSIFMSSLAFEDPGLLRAAKFAVLAGSGLAATFGLIAGRLQSSPAAVSTALSGGSDPRHNSRPRRAARR